jgi:hypothetical protein
MNTVSYPEITRRAHQVLAQGKQFDEKTHKGKNYFKNLESKSFDFTKPSMCLTRDLPHEQKQIQPIDYVEGMNFPRISLSQDSLETYATKHAQDYVRDNESSLMQAHDVEGNMAFISRS